MRGQLQLAASDATSNRQQLQRTTKDVCLDRQLIDTNLHTAASGSLCTQDIIKPLELSVQASMTSHKHSRIIVFAAARTKSVSIPDTIRGSLEPSLIFSSKKLYLKIPFSFKKGPGSSPSTVIIAWW